MSITSASWLGLAGACLLAGGVLLPGTAATGSEHHPSTRQARTPVRCDGAVQHPIQVKATALDALQRGSIVRVRVTTTSRKPLERGEVNLVSTGGATLASASRASFGRLVPGEAATTEFAVRLPAAGHRFLLQFRVTGDSGTGLESRGATLNLLPDGPADPGRVVTSSSGERIVEYRARRVD